MASPYEVRWGKRAARDLAGLEPTTARLQEPARRLEEPLQGYGDFRVLYTIDDAIRVVDIVRVGDRKDVY